MDTIKDIEKTFKFKKDLIHKLGMYLGAKLEEKQLNGRKVWTITSKDYIKLSIENVKRQLKMKNLKFPSRAVKLMLPDFILLRGSGGVPFSGVKL